MTKQSIKPDFVIRNMPSMVSDDEAGKKGASEEERQLYSMSKSAGWKIFTEHLERVLEELDNINNLAIEQGLGFDQIGQNAVVVSSTKSIIKKITTRVNDAIEACETAINDK